MRVEVGIENCPDGAEEGKVRGGGPAKQLNRLEGLREHFSQVEEGLPEWKRGARRNGDLPERPLKAQVNWKSLRWGG